MEVHNFLISFLPPKFLSLCRMLQYFPVRPGENEAALEAVWYLDVCCVKSVSSNLVVGFCQQISSLSG